jgi:hypothetical protein
LTVFCITPNSTDKESYTLTKLKFADSDGIYDMHS